MISVILYGRNDSYGYNLHKRAALSLNCIAELLDQPDDEILFVDYNTPDDFPSFPEAIADTLTARARGLLRVLRVRAAQHRRFADRSHLLALEPVARNVALRRSNPANRWVLSTNTDMIFVPRRDGTQGGTLSGIAAGLADGSFHLPRMELPESLWESLDRFDPRGCIARVGAWGARFHLDEVVESPYPSVRYDGPGDFQLMLRADLVAMHGFDEAMLLGWHVDFNIAQRLALRRGPTGTLEAALRGYHCDHTRQVTPAHRPGGVENDMHRFGMDITQAELPAQADDWGLAGETIEEFRLDTVMHRYEAALAGAVPTPQTAPMRVLMSAETFDRVDYDARHALPFLLDPLASHPPGTRLGWFAARGDLLELFAAAWRGLGFTVPIAVAEGAAIGACLPEGAVWSSAEAIGAQADVLVFDFALPHGPALGFVTAGLRAMLRAEAARPAGLPARRFIAVNAIHNRFEGLVRSHIGAARSPLGTRIRQGMLLHRPGGVIEVQAMMLPGEAGRRQGVAIRPLERRRGHVLHGPYLDLAPGEWRFEQRFRPDPGWPHPGALKLRAVANGQVFASRTVLLGGLGPRRLQLDFTVPDADDLAPPLLMEIVVTGLGHLRGLLDEARLIPRAANPDERMRE